MYCPRCGNQQITKETRFCSNCGFLMSEVSQMVINGGFSPENISTGITPRKEGIKRGLFLFLSTFLVVPLIALITIALDAEPFFVAAAAIITFWGGILRMIYALLFESNVPNEKTLEEKIVNSTQKYLNKNNEPFNVPPHQTMPVSAYNPPRNVNWRDTGDLSPNARLRS